MSKPSLLPPLPPPLLRVPLQGKCTLEFPGLLWIPPIKQSCGLWGRGNSIPYEDLVSCDWNTAVEDPSSSHTANFLLSPSAPEAS